MCMQTHLHMEADVLGCLDGGQQVPLSTSHGYVVRGVEACGPHACAVIYLAPVDCAWANSADHRPLNHQRF